MKSSTRYLLIAFGFFIFIILAPLLILYVSGTRLNFSSRNTDSTGILDAKTNPSNATLFIDGKEHSKTPAIARFLDQGEYVFTLTKDGYYDWSKRLPIESDKVTYAQSGVEVIQLIKKSQPTLIVPNGVKSFALTNNEVWFTENNSVGYAPINDFSNQKFIPLKFTPQNIQSLRDKGHLFISNKDAYAVIDTQTHSVFPIDFNLNPDDAVVIGNVLIFQAGTELQNYNLITKKSVTITNDISGFTMLGNTAYFADNSGNISIGVWDGQRLKDIQPIVSGQAIAKGQNQLIITNQKRLFLLDSSKNLYRVNQTLELVASQVEAVNLDLKTDELVIRTSSELGFYNFLQDKLQLLTRSTNPALSFLIRSNIGYGFVGTSTGLEAIEIDSRDQQNRYQLLHNEPIWQLAITDDQKTIIALQGDSLISMEIRN